MNSIYALIDHSGLILRTGTSIAASEDFLVLACDSTVSDETHYYDFSTESFVEKEPIDVSYIIDSLRVDFVNLPLGVIAHCLGAAIQSDEDGMQIEFQKPGSYLIEFMNNKRYVDKTLEVTVG